MHTPAELAQLLLGFAAEQAAWPVYAEDLVAGGADRARHGRAEEFGADRH